MSEKREPQEGWVGLDIVPKGSFWTGHTWLWSIRMFTHGDWVQITGGEAYTRKGALTLAEAALHGHIGTVEIIKGWLDEAAESTGA